MEAENLKMKDERPYLIQAYREWIQDSGLTPYVLVFADGGSGASVPREHVKDGHIVLNISDVSTKNYLCNENGMMFDARFSGKSFPVFVTLDNIRRVYAKENGEGVSFSPVFVEQAEVLQEQPVPEKKKVPFLSVVK